MAANNRSIEARWLSAPGVVLWAFGKLNEEEEQKHRPHYSVEECCGFCGVHCVGLCCGRVHAMNLAEQRSWIHDNCKHPLWWLVTTMLARKATERRRRGGHNTTLFAPMWSWIRTWTNSFQYGLVVSGFKVGFMIRSAVAFIGAMLPGMKGATIPVKDKNVVGQTSRK